MSISRRQVIFSMLAAALASAMRTRPTRAQADEAVRITALSRIIYLMFPHEHVAAEHYRAAAEHVLARAERDSGMASALSAGIVALDERVGMRFEAVETDRQIAELRTLSGERFFVAVRAAAIESLYRNPEVWTVLGYEGSSIEYGGYVDRGFDDIDWLPDATEPE